MPLASYNDMHDLIIARFCFACPSTNKLFFKFAQTGSMQLNLFGSTMLEIIFASSLLEEKIFFAIYFFLNYLR